MKKISVIGMLFLCTALCAGIFSACSEPLILAYRDAPASFEAVFPSENGGVRCACVRTGDTLTLTILLPERSAGLSVIRTGAYGSGDSGSGSGACVLAADDGCEIPLSAEASRAINALFAVLYAPTDTPPVPSRSPDGKETVLTLPAGTLVLGENLLPASAACPAADGELRTVLIEHYRIMPESSVP